ncbi:MAG: hypothetical protein PHQ12_02510 [Chthoniobacteraceae bacterium]|nr:hypothetical protein [Chthoniobacteraceae bacterium]
MITLVFALPQESRGVVAALRSPSRSGSPALPVVRGRLGDREILVLHTGVGAEAVRRTLAHYWKMRETYGGRWETLIAAGYAGGLDPALPAGALVLAGDAPLERAREILGTRAHVGGLATASEPVETPEAKAAFFRATDALAVDMETEAVAAFCRANGIPWLTLRAISDPAGVALPVPHDVWFDAVKQRPRSGALLRFLATRPARWLPFARFVAHVFRARRALTAALLDLAARL